jgi:hypothetical protein
VVFVVRLINLTGKKFGRLTVLKRSEKRNANVSWECLCECGKTIVAFGFDLKRGHTSSCGCLQVDAVTKHNLWKSPIYKIWLSMIQRCTNSRASHYKDYGGRGIAVCDRWLNSFECFYEDMNYGYHKGLSIERIDVNGNYTPNNCKWIAKSEQQNNKRNNHLITYNGKTQTLTQWAIELNINSSTLNKRITRSGWSTEDALTKRLQK